MARGAATTANQSSMLKTRFMKNDEEPSRWMQSAVKKPGAFKAQAKRAGKSVAAYATEVLKEGSRASARTKKRASLAKTFAKFRPGAK